MNSGEPPKLMRPHTLGGTARTTASHSSVDPSPARTATTLKANLSVGLPLDLLVIRRDEYKPLHERRIEHGDAYFDAISKSWSDALRNAFHSLPDYTFAQTVE
jgi:putative proteasome-type protease